MCFNTTPAIPNSQKQLGDKNVGFLMMPRFGDGTMAGNPITDTQGFGIPPKAKRSRTAAELLDYMHSPERVQAMWTLSKQVPANTRFDGTVIDDPLVKHGATTSGSPAKHNVYIADLMPTKFWTDAMFVASQKILARRA